MKIVIFTLLFLYTDKIFSWFLTYSARRLGGHIEYQLHGSMVMSGEVGGGGGGEEDAGALSRHIALWHMDDNK